MASSKTRFSHKATSSDIPLPRHRPRLSEEPPKMIQSDIESTVLTSPAQQRFSKLQKPRLQDVLAASPYAASQGGSMQRSLSVAKSNGRSGKQMSPVKEKGSAMMNFAKSEVAINRAKASSNEPRQRPAREALNLTTYPKETSGEVSFTNSFNSSLLHPAMDSPRSHLPKKFQQAKTVKSIESNLSKAVRELGHSGDRDKEILLYSQAFADLIAVNPSCKSLLSKIRSKYELWLSEVSENTEITKYQNEILSLQAALLKEMEEKSLFMRKLEKVARENVELSRSCEGFQNKCYEYEEKLYQLANTKLEGFPPTEDTWKLLVSELGSYKVWKSKVVKELRLTQSKERKLLELVQALKSRGFPVEEVYNTDVRRPVKSQRSSVRSQDSEEDSERLSYGSPAMKAKPESVPELRLEMVERDVPSSSSPSEPPSNDESLRKAISRSPLHPLSSATKPILDSKQSSAVVKSLVPKIALPEGSVSSDGGFQQEFMSKYSEFSESWRRQIDALKH